MAIVFELWYDRQSSKEKNVNIEAAYLDAVDWSHDHDHHIL